MQEAAIIIPHYNDTVRLGKCLAVLVPQLVSVVDLVIVDNDSTDSLDAIRRTYPSLRIVIKSQQGAAHARNWGMSETTAPRLFFLDCDCVPASDWLATALRIADTADIIGGNITVFDETDRKSVV